MRIVGHQSNYNPFVKDLLSDRIFFVSDKERGKDKKTEGYTSAATLTLKRMNDEFLQDKIAKKVARGERVTEKEKDMLRKSNPEKLRKAEMANKRRKEIKNRLKYAKDDKEARFIILGAKIEAKHFFDSKDPEYGELLMEASNKVEEDYYKIRPIRANISDKSGFVLAKNRGRIFDKKM